MQTIRDTILSFPGLDDSDRYLDKVLTDRSLDGAAAYTKEEGKTVNLCAADLYAVVGNNPDFTENKLSITWSSVDYLKTAARLYRENGEPEKANAILPAKKPIRLTGKAKYTS